MELFQALVLIDGEHTEQVIRTTIKNFSKKFAIKAALLIGGTEKLSKNPDYGVPYEILASKDIAAQIVSRATQYQIDTIIDLSDEPVLSPQKRFELINSVIAAGYSYQGADFIFKVPKKIKLNVATIGVFGLGKRIGKTGHTINLARYLTTQWPSKNIMILAMGRGGPSKPEIAQGKKGIQIDDLINFAQQGKHAASDYLENAALAHLNTIGCMRCGGGLFGTPFYSNTIEGGLLAQTKNPDLLILDGSGACVPLIKPDKILLLIPAYLTKEDMLFATTPYRIRSADAIILSLSEQPFTSRNHIHTLKKVITQLNPNCLVTATILRPKPISSLKNKKIIYFTTAPAEIHQRLKNYLEKHYHTKIVRIIHSLSNRISLEKELLDKSILEVDAFLVEIKAAGINTVAIFAKQNNIETILCDNEPVALQSESSLDTIYKQLATELT